MGAEAASGAASLGRGRRRPGGRAGGRGRGPAKCARVSGRGAARGLGAGRGQRGVASAQERGCGVGGGERPAGAAGPAALQRGPLRPAGSGAPSAGAAGRRKGQHPPAGSRARAGPRVPAEEVTLPSPGPGWEGRPLSCRTLTLSQALPGPGPGLRRTALPGGSRIELGPTRRHGVSWPGRARTREVGVGGKKAERAEGGEGEGPGREGAGTTVLADWRHWAA